MNLRKLKNFIVISYVINSLGLICKGLIISQVFYEYTGKYEGYVNNILLAYIICIGLMLLLIAIGLYGGMSSDYDKMSDEMFKKQVDGLSPIVSRNPFKQCWMVISTILMILAAVSGILLSKWVLAIVLSLAVIGELAMIAVAHDFMSKHKDRIERLRPKVRAEEKSKGKVKDEKKEDNPIIQRLQSIE
jgi:uncharacterized protein YacL